MSDAIGDIPLSLLRASSLFGTAAAHASADFMLRTGETPELKADCAGVHYRDEPERSISGICVGKSRHLGTIPT
jgi:hypothetical protein